MSFSDSEIGNADQYKTFGQITRDRLLHHMLGTAKEADPKSWKVLIMDKVTMKVMSASCKMADITDQGVSLVEDLFRRRQPLPSMDAVYFVQPTKENVIMFLSDMSGRVPLYKKAYVFFSTPVAKELINHIKCDMSVLPRIGALREMNLEYFPIESQAFVTDHNRMLEDILGENIENSRKFETSLTTIATRLATVFASLNELPKVWYRNAKPQDSPSANFRAMIPAMLAAAISPSLTKYKSIPNYPQKPTCDLLILDRSADLIAPVIHEWTYEAMCYDLLDLDGNKYVYEVPSKTGDDPKMKEVILEEHDPIWHELRHSHIADASEKLHDKMTTFVNKNKAAQMQRKEGGEISTRDLQKIVQALPQYGEQVEKISTHVEIAGTINSIIRDEQLINLGQLEQDLVFGDAGPKELITFLRTNQSAAPENKLRLLMIYALVYPEKFEGDKGVKLMQLAKLSTDDMKVVQNMQLLVGSPTNKNNNASGKADGGFALKFDGKKPTKRAARKDRSGEEEEAWQLSRFYPIVEELIESIEKGDLLKTGDYSCRVIDDPSLQGDRTLESKSLNQSSVSSQAAEKKAPISKRSRRTATWAKSNQSDDGCSSDSVLRRASMDFRQMGQRIFIFMIGGATRSELRVCHKMTLKLRREVIVGSTSFDDPPKYLKKLRLLPEETQPPLDALHI